MMKIYISSSSEKVKVIFKLDDNYSLSYNNGSPNITTNFNTCIVNWNSWSKLPWLHCMILFLNLVLSVLSW